MDPIKTLTDGSVDYSARRRGTFRGDFNVGARNFDADFYVSAVLTDSKGQTANAPPTPLLGYLVRYDADVQRLYTYDGRLNLVQMTEVAQDGEEQVTTYSYDALDRLRTVLRADGSVHRYTYDAMSRRLTTTVEVPGTPVKATRHVYGPGWETLADVEKVGDGPWQVARLYVSTSGMDSQVAMIARENGVWKPYLYLRDYQGSVVALYDCQQERIVESYEYEPYGMPTIYGVSGGGSVVEIASSAHGNRHLYTGREWEPELQFYHYRHRTYSPIDKRFMQGDPIGLAGGWNYYAYCGGNPVNAKDPMGLDSVILQPNSPEYQELRELIRQEKARMAALEEKLRAIKSEMPYNAYFIHGGIHKAIMVFDYREQVWVRGDFSGYGNSSGRCGSLSSNGDERGSVAVNSDCDAFQLLQPDDKLEEGWIATPLQNAATVNWMRQQVKNPDYYVMPLWTCIQWSNYCAEGGDLSNWYSTVFSESIQEIITGRPAGGGGFDDMPHYVVRPSPDKGGR